VVAPIVKLKADDVVTRINLLLATVTHYLPAQDPIIAELIGDARKSIPVNAAAAHSAWACACQLAGDVEEAVYHIDNALKLESGNEFLLANQTSILVNLGFMSKAQVAYARAAAPERGQMTHVWNMGYVCGAFQSMREILKKAEAMKIDVGGLDIDTAIRAASLMDQLGVRDSDVAKILDVVGEVLRAHRLFYLGATPKIAVFEGEGHAPFISMAYEVGVSAEEAFDLYYEFVNRLTESKDQLSSAISVSFQSAHDLHERRAA
jgi:hypothetical protein